MTKEEEKAMQDDHLVFMDDLKDQQAKHIFYALCTYAACFIALAGIFLIEFHYG